jgi:hypothetical protein
MDPGQIDEAIVLLRYLYRQAQDVYEERNIAPHYVEMDAVMSALSNSLADAIRAKEELMRVIQLDVAYRYSTP